MNYHKTIKQPILFLLLVFTSLISCKNQNFKTLQFDSKLQNSNLKFWYENSDSEYSRLLRSKHPIDSLIKEAKSDTEKTSKIMNWVHKQWKHNGDNEPQKRDAISILEEVREGKNFRCVEYGIVLTACLNSAGLKARLLALKTKDVETREYGAGHVLSEVYLNDLEKWVMIDPQWNVMPILNGVPLNAVEFQKAISENFEELEIKGGKTSKRHYIDWIYPYLYYFDIAFDNTEGTKSKSNTVKGNSKLMLVPLGAKKPRIFQRNRSINNCVYTNSLKDFYAPPN